MITNLSLRCCFDRSNLNASISEISLRDMQIASLTLFAINGTALNIDQNSCGFEMPESEGK
jgi:hypothetical protein